MSEKRFQVFVSSTFTDLKEEREAVFNALMKFNCIPAGMETFPAFDEEQLEYIKRVIDDSDYYILIIGGRYGSVTDDGISFTEKEYDYAVSKRIPILTFVHANPLKIPVGKTDQDMEKKRKLDEFIAKASKSRQRDTWSSHAELSSAVLQSLSYQFRTNPRVGWVRGNVAAGVDILTEINELRKKNESLTILVETLEKSLAPAIDNLASLDEEFDVRISSMNENFESYVVTFQLTWQTIFAIVGPRFMTASRADLIAAELAKFLRDEKGLRGNHERILDTDFNTIKLQFIARNYLKPVDGATMVNGAVTELLVLTEAGKRALLEIKAIRGPK
jgi:hypothetical protein